MAAPEHPKNAPRRILVVDDEALVCDSIKRALASDEHEVETAISAEEALNAVRRSKFDLIILDYEMPRMKGDKLASAIRGLVPLQSIIMITAYGEALRYAGDFPLAVDRILSKPFELQELREVVRQLTK